MVRKEIGREVMNFGEKDELEKPMDVDKCIDGEYLNEENSGMDIGEMECQKVISLEEYVRRWIGLKQLLGSMVKSIIA